MKKADFTTLEYQQTSIEAALLWQYNQAERLQSLIEAKQQWNYQNNLTFWYLWALLFFDMRYAQYDGLALWAIILNMPLYFDATSSPANYPAFGFDAYGLPYFNSNFATTVSGISGMTVEERRILLRLRYYQLVTRGTVPEINAMLNDVFGQGAAYVIDNHDMTMTYVFNIQPSNNLVEFFNRYDILPRPAGVEMNIAYGLTYSFGFADYQSNFNNSNFVGSL